MRIIKRICLSFFIFPIIYSVAQDQGPIDSLIHALSYTDQDTVKIKILCTLCDKFRNSNPEKALQYGEQGISIAENINLVKDLSFCYNNIGVVHKECGRFEQAKKSFRKSIKIAVSLHNNKAISKSYNNLGEVFREQGQYNEAIKYYLKSLKINEDLLNKTGVAECYNNIGIVYYYQGMFNKTIEYYQKSLEISEELNDKTGMAACLNNIGIVHAEHMKYDDAIEFFIQSLRIREKINDKNGMAQCLNNLGIIYNFKANYSKAIRYYLKSLKIVEEQGNKTEISRILGNISLLYLNLKDYDTAINYAENCLSIAKEIGILNTEKYAYSHLSTAYEGLNNTGKALKYYKLYTEAKDSLFNAEKNKQITEIETRYQTEKKEQQIKLQKTQLAKKQAEVKRKNLQRNAFIGGFALVLLLAIVIFRSYRQQKKQKAVIAQKNKNITDSINYAVRIQQAILPTEKDLTGLINLLGLGGYFILFKPKDIVSGDFYWMAKIKKWLIVAAVDCTGHGVPGAFMSMLGVSFLNEIVRKEEITQANQVLNELREYVIKSLQQKGIEDEAKDGMDMALIVIDTETNKLQFAGANNPLYIVRAKGESKSDANIRIDTNDTNNEVGSRQSAKKSQMTNDLMTNDNKKETLNYELIEIRADRMPIGIYDEMNDFKNNKLQLQKGDTLYIFSDGYKDQFGGEKGKKLKSKPFKELLLSIYNKSMEEQKAILDNTFEDWKGDLEQIDDILVMGIRI